MRHPATQALFAYWNEVRGERPVPRRLEIQPARIAELLLDTFILERTETSTFRFRLAGTRVAQQLGLELRSRDFLSCWREGDQGLLAHHLEAVSDLGRVALWTGEADVAAGPVGSLAGSSYTFELLLLPLVHTGHAIDRLLCMLVPLDGSAGARSKPIRGLRLLAAETVWPEAQAESARDLADRQLPLHPHVRMARIVRQGRRQFRVYDGGREETRDADKSEPLA
ncbi:MAG: PAS domain-containing protein [Hyphomicrobium sp.]|uniref:PAS domain-containing protein n=1 Tax=Hyphomicrobium sp. TaxID=82 RepID=UPI003D0B9FF4